MVSCMLSAEEHRALVRRQLRAVLATGTNPLDLFANDQKASHTGMYQALRQLMLQTNACGCGWRGRVSEIT